MNYWRSGKGASSANKHSCKGGWKTCLATWALLSKTHLLTGRANLRLSHKEVSKPTAEDEARDLKASPLLSVLQPKTEVRSQVNIPPSRCLQHASGRDKTRPATPPPPPPLSPDAPGSAYPRPRAPTNCQQEFNCQGQTNDTSHPGGRPFF